MTVERPRAVLVALVPRVLEGAVAALVGVRTTLHVVQFAQATAEELQNEFRAAIVNLEVPSGVRSEIVITLPDPSSGSTSARVSTAGQSRTVDLSTTTDFAALLDLHLAG